MTKSSYTPLSRIKSLPDFKEYLLSIDVELPIDETLIEGDKSPLAQTYDLSDGFTIGNRFCILPMEGWDGTIDGRPTELTKRRWKNFGRSGAKLIWGCEAASVLPDGRANPNQLMIIEENQKDFEEIRKILIEEHKANFGNTDDLLIGLQLTHSGRFSRPNNKTKLEPKILYHHPLLDEIFSIDPNLPVMSDTEIDDLIAHFVKAAKLSQEIGFDFVDVKHCHGYLGHEFLSAVDRTGKYGGSFDNRTRFLREIVRGIQNECPGLKIGVRFSTFDFPPYQPDENNFGRVKEFRNSEGKYPYAFGGDPQHPNQYDLTETKQFVKLCETIGVELLNFTQGSPYYNPHVTRPAYFPPSDGYNSPEEPLVGVARQIKVGEVLTEHAGSLLCVGSGYTYLQDYLPFVAHAVIRKKMIDFVGLGRMVLSYPEMPADILVGKTLNRRKICRTFSDCTTAPRKGLVSGCYPLDSFYKELPVAKILKEIKRK
jgi:NADPH2 dehydrogenase